MIDPDPDLEFCDWLMDTLVPDLYDSDMPETAEDFERCVEIIRRLKAQSLLDPGPTP